MEITRDNPKMLDWMWVKLWIWMFEKIASLAHDLTITVQGPFNQQLGFDVGFTGEIVAPPHPLEDQVSQSAINSGAAQIVQMMQGL